MKIPYQIDKLLARLTMIKKKRSKLPISGIKKDTTIDPLEKIFANYISYKGLVLRLHRLSKLNTKKTNLLKNAQKI